MIKIPLHAEAIAKKVGLQKISCAPAEPSDIPKAPLGEKHPIGFNKPFSVPEHPQAINHELQRLHARNA